MPHGSVNETIGEVRCPFCKGKAAVRKTQGKRPKLYYNCPADGPVFLNTENGQEWMRCNARLYGAVRPDELPAGAPPAQAPPPSPTDERNARELASWAAAQARAQAPSSAETQAPPRAAHKKTSDFLADL